MMRTDRRNFIRKAAVATAGLLSYSTGCSVLHNSQAMTTAGKVFLRTKILPAHTPDLYGRGR
jgi:hypothetical protein